MLRNNVRIRYNSFFVWPNGQEVDFGELGEGTLTYIASFGHDDNDRREAWRVLNDKFPLDPPVAAALRMLCGGQAGIQEMRT